MDIVQKYLYTIIDFGTAVPMFKPHDGIMVDTSVPLPYAFNVCPRLMKYKVNQPHLSSFDDSIKLLKNIRQLWFENKPFEVYLINTENRVDRLYVQKCENFISVQEMQSFDPKEIAMPEPSIWNYFKYGSKNQSIEMFKKAFYDECRNDLGWKYCGIDISMNCRFFDKLEFDLTKVKKSIQTNSWVSNFKCRMYPFVENAILFCTTDRPNLCCCPYCGTSFETEEFMPCTYKEMKNKKSFDLYIYGSVELQKHMKSCKEDTGKCECCGNRNENCPNKRERMCVIQYVRKLKHGVIKRSI